MKILGKIISPLLLVLAFLFIAVASFATVGYVLGQRSTASISGTIAYNGVLPADLKDATIVVTARRFGESQYLLTNVTLPVTETAAWAWNQAQSGRTYELQARLMMSGQEIGRSDMITVTAPAANEVMAFNITQKEVGQAVLPSASPSPIAATATATPLSAVVTPQPVVATPQPVTAATKVSLNGKVNFVGYAPAGATLLMQAKKDSDTAFLTFSTVAAKDDVTWNYANAEAGALYTVKAILQNNGQMVAESADTQMAAPANGQFLQVVSPLKPPAPAATATITGSIDLNGVIQNNSSVLILQRKLGETNYTPVKRLAAADGITWTFSGAIPGQWYELTAAYQVNENNVAVGNVVAVTAPGNELVLRINTGASIPAPSSQPTLLNCGTRQGDGKWPARLQLPVVNQANEYWVQVGSQPGSSDIYNAKTNNSGSNPLQITALFADNQSYYVRYAYAYCSDCGKEANYSGFSSSLYAKCP